MLRRVIYHSWKHLDVRMYVHTCTHTYTHCPCARVHTQLEKEAGSSLNLVVGQELPYLPAHLPHKRREAASKRDHPSPRSMLEL